MILSTNTDATRPGEAGPRAGAPSSRSRSWPWWLLAALVVLGALLTRVFWDGRRALADGDRAFAGQDFPEAIDRWGRAARWYAPSAPHVASAYQRLESLAQNAEAAQDHVLALSAWRAVRSAALATRSLYTPYADHLARADQRIAALMAHAETSSLDPGTSLAAREAWHLARLARHDAPSLAWSVLALLGFSGWVGAGFVFAWRGVDERDRLRRHTAVLCGLGVLIGLLVWLTGLYFA